MVGSCKEGGIFNRKCKKTCSCTEGWVCFAVIDAQGKDYFNQNPDLANYRDFTVYDENWKSAVYRAEGDTWDSLKDKILVNEHYITYYFGRSEPYGIDAKKTFYVKFKEDIDTLRLEYKVKNECRHMSYMRIYLNDSEVIPTVGSNGEQDDPNYIFPYRKK